MYFSTFGYVLSTIKHSVCGYFIGMKSYEIDSSKQCEANSIRSFHYIVQIHLIKSMWTHMKGKDIVRSSSIYVRIDHKNFSLKITNLIKYTNVKAVQGRSIEIID